MSDFDPLDDDRLYTPEPAADETVSTIGTDGEDDDTNASEEAEVETPELVFGSVDEWLRRYWRFTYRRRVSAKGSGTGRWRADWWMSDEALQRLTALWRGWEASRQDPALGTSAWWTNHADPHMSVLLSLDGPYAGSEDGNEVGEPLPYNRPPRGLFDPDKEPSGYYEDDV
ncbi:DUF4913 domain-containing protein [Clavibacter michiganensis]|uniref:DUF4913 domain-containing protein n=1 Tax=Clavibacter michiganensis TaxID=28447 RepID=UPI0026DADE4F|nr:DUF4913 domain-containing protein [Clavibacter michiganensis]MDO4039327.1 DUF4913 domain-containing protein [Clavibacter michiganensis]MDO4063964.1 DUF4913 domain-containing protein [Clavibacter michiganensis]MDO4110177.1 DUF4913 domain-containing protein [Clavibacter michiganensis]MDO4113355.1 DUF4913 domain-containing protein [Clavibacter michiganensis]MDO4116691.1 DUF4913 domain-containing protein [Clavibacter michiganensis]